MSIRMFQDVKASGIERPNDRFVALMLADFFNDRTGRCDPSVKTLADITRLGEKTVRRSLERLEKEGWITVSRRAGKTPSYRIHPGQALTNHEENDPGQNHSHPGHSDASPWSNDAGTLVKSGPHPGQALTNEPITGEPVEPVNRGENSSTAAPPSALPGDGGPADREMAEAGAFAAAAAELKKTLQAKYD